METTTKPDSSEKRKRETVEEKRKMKEDEKEKFKSVSYTTLDFLFQQFGGIRKVKDRPDFLPSHGVAIKLMKEKKKQENFSGRFWENSLPLSIWTKILQYVIGNTHISLKLAKIRLGNLRLVSKKMNGIVLKNVNTIHFLSNTAYNEFCKLCGKDTLLHYIYGMWPPNSRPTKVLDRISIDSVPPLIIYLSKSTPNSNLITDYVKDHPEFTIVFLN
jgi:hypothetical protein